MFSPTRSGKVKGIAIQIEGCDTRLGNSSHKQLDYPKEDVIKSFYFLIDCVRFCKNKPIFKNEELVSKVKAIYIRVSLYFLDVSPESIPTDPMENYRYGKQFGLQENLGESELRDLALIDWRNSEHWEYWAKNKYGNNRLGEYCIMMTEKLKAP